MTDPNPEAGSWRVLLVDDQPDNLAVLRGALEDEGYQLAFASNGEDALEILQDLSPHLILLDIMMPGIDGFETCRRMKQNEIMRDTPIIFITAKRETEDIIHGFRVGGVDYITKPFQQEEVCARVRNHLELVHLRRSLEAQNRHTQELLDQTLNGSMSIFNEILAGFDHALFNRGTRLRELVKAWTPNLGLEDTWQLELAAMFLPIGLVTIPSSIVARHRENKKLTSAEEELILKAPEASAKLLEKIPNLKKVSHIVRYHQKSYDGGGYPQDGVQGEKIPVESRILKLLCDFVDEEAQGHDSRDALDRLRARTGLYDALLLRKFQAYLEKMESARPKGEGEQEIPFQELRVGQTLADKIENLEGTVLLNAGQIVSEMHLMLLRNHNDFIGIREPIRIRAGRWKSALRDDSET